MIYLHPAFYSPPHYLLCKAMPSSASVHVAEGRVGSRAHLHYEGCWGDCCHMLCSGPGWSGGILGPAH